MQRTLLRGLSVAAVLMPAVAFTQSGMKPTAATYITAEEVATVSALPGTDRTIKVVDIGGEHFSVGTIHRGPTPVPGAARGAAGAGRAAGGAAAAGGRAGGAAAGAGRAAAATPCGEQMATAPTSGGASGMIAHDSQTEGYLVTSGGGTLVTGGKIINGRESGPNDEVTTTLNGPSCNGTAYGADIVRREMKPGDIVIIPPGVPHGWTGITDHVDYLSFRPSGQTLTAGYVNPAIKK